uniref:Uncharacterized protein n=1 Tax=Anguilla anguilla TaxID=7936 RepID=A0A0E9P7J3_ANGAN
MSIKGPCISHGTQVKLMKDVISERKLKWNQAWRSSDVKKTSLSQLIPIRALLIKNAIVGVSRNTFKCRFIVAYWRS